MDSRGLGSKRIPLAETSGNLPALKKHKGRVPEKKDLKPNESDALATTSTATSTTTPATSTTTSHSAAKAARLVGDELKTWQASWKKIMRESVVYFDTQGCDSTNQAQLLEQKRAHRALKYVGCDIVPFYDRDVSIIVSRRPFSSSKTYAANDIFHDATALKIKVWDYDKVFRFLKNLGVSESISHERTGNLSNLLREEKIFGSTDKDPNARRDDLYYLEKNYIYAYDLTQAVRPIIVREWSNDSYPSFYLTLDGKCPFIQDNSENLERKKLRRLQKFEASKNFRDMLKKVSYMVSPTKLASSNFHGTSTSTDSIAKDKDEAEERDTDTANDTIVEHSGDDAQDVQELQELYDFKPPIGLNRNSSIMQPMHASASTSKFFDVAASGYNGASNALQYSMDSTLNSVALQNGNGLGPAVSQVPSKNVNNLKRRIFMKRQLSKSVDVSKDHELKPGYCENCRVKYDHFDDHIVSNRHRNFACNDENFADIDSLIEVLNDSRRMGYVSSNGDYSCVGS